MTERDSNDPTGDVKHWLHHYLTRLHGSLLWKLDGLGERDARWPMTPTGSNVLGIIKHVASIEAGYLGEVVGRPLPDPPPWFADDAEVNADMWAGPDETTASVRAFATRVWAHADETIEALPLDAPAHVPWWGAAGETTFGRILVHVIDDVARHAGQIDILREMIDGGAGMSERLSNLPEEDALWWADYVETLKKVASDADMP